MITYQQTVEWMFQQLPMYQRVGKQAFKKDLSNTLKLAEYLGNPQRKFKSIHVAGTNGKGSVSHMLASVFQTAGYKTGLYTSPHLKDFRERIRINGKMISEQDVIDFISESKDFLRENQLSFFEMTVGMAFEHFACEQVDIAIIEVGLGGRLDSTNILLPELSVVTNIGRDHVAFLGSDLSGIAREKAGIIKPGVPVVIGETLTETKPVFQEVAITNHSEIIFAEEKQFQDYKSDLKGVYQKKNIKTLLAAVDILRQSGWEIPEDALKEALLHVKFNTGLRGRWDILGETPKVICDTAHNTDGLKLVMEQLKREKYQNLHVVLGVVNDKDLVEILPLFPKTATYYFAKPDVPRGLEVEILYLEAQKFQLAGRKFSSVQKAYRSALENAGDKDLIFIGGSNFTVAEVI